MNDRSGPSCAPEIDWLHDLFRRHGSVDFASARARELAAAADGALGQSPANADRDFLSGTIRHVAGLAAA